MAAKTKGCRAEGPGATFEPKTNQLLRASGLKT